jgi:hypothetical protein
MFLQKYSFKDVTYNFIPLAINLHCGCCSVMMPQDFLCQKCFENLDTEQEDCFEQNLKLKQSDFKLYLLTHSYYFP